MRQSVKSWIRCPQKASKGWRVGGSVIAALQAMTLLLLLGW